MTRLLLSVLLCSVILLADAQTHVTNATNEKPSSAADALAGPLVLQLLLTLIPVLLSRLF